MRQLGVVEDSMSIEEPTLSEIWSDVVYCQKCDTKKHAVFYIPDSNEKITYNHLPETAGMIKYEPNNR